MVGKRNQNKGAELLGKAAYVEFVDSLFADTKSLFIGIALQASIMAAFILETQLYGATVFIGIAFANAFWRGHIATGYKLAAQSVSDTSLEHRANMAAVWEKRYLIPSGLTALNIGIFCNFGLTQGSSDFAVSTAMILLLSPLPTIVGRVYGSKRLASIILIGQFLPAILGYLILGGGTHYFLALLILPYIFFVLSMVDNVRATVIRAVNGNAEKVELGRQFDIALSNMPHGLMMFDENNRVVVINEQASQIFNIPKSTTANGRSLDVLFRYALRHSIIPAANLEVLHAVILKLLSRSADRQQVRLDDGRYLDLAVSERAKGGTVLTLEDATDRVLSAKKIERMARFDGLTGLANREHFGSLVSHYLTAARPRDYYALLVVDIDDFKYVNDAVGHAQGDELLRTIARKLQVDDRQAQFGCRLGGDEFLLFIGDLKSSAEASDYVERLAGILTGVHKLCDEEIYASCSIGYLTDENSTFNLENAIQSADLALYSAKNDSKGAWCQFDQLMHDKYQRRQKIKQQLGNALLNNELTLIFQPLVDATTGRMVSCEALSRWHNPEFGQISPAEFIPLAEEMGVINKITEQVLDVATHQCAKWPKHMSVSVNLSQIDFRSGDIVAVIDAALEKSGLEPERLEIEVTETAMAYNETEMIEKLHAIHERGVRIALDDFGTGQSSLSYLHRLPLDKVKIDRSFVVGIDTGETPVALLYGIAGLCRTLNLDVTVEGVETQSQLDLVVGQVKIDRIQGYIYGPGLPASGIDTLARLGKIPFAEQDIAHAVAG